MAAAAGTAAAGTGSTGFGIVGAVREKIRVDRTCILLPAELWRTAGRGQQQ
jgi:hypothetical protein